MKTQSQFQLCLKYINIILQIYKLDLLLNLSYLLLWLFYFIRYLRMRLLTREFGRSYSVLFIRKKTSAADISIKSTLWESRRQLIEEQTIHETFLNEYQSLVKSILALYQSRDIIVDAFIIEKLRERFNRRAIYIFLSDYNYEESHESQQSGQDKKYFSFKEFKISIVENNRREFFNFERNKIIPEALRPNQSFNNNQKNLQTGKTVQIKPKREAFD